MATTDEAALRWDLDSLYPHPESEEFAPILSGFRDDLRRLADRSDELPAARSDQETVAQWVAFLDDYQSVDGRASDLEAFIECHAAADAGNKTFQLLEAELAALAPLRQRIAANIEFALRDVSDADFAAFVQTDSRLQELEFFLQQSRKNAALRLPKEQELLAAELDVDGIHAWGRLYDRISSEVRIPVMERGEVVEKSPGQVRLDSPERTVRENNFFAADKAWSHIADTCADALNHIAGTRLTRYRRLGLPDHLQAPLRANRMQRQTLETMWSAVRDRKSVLLQYLDLKAKRLGLEKLSWYDLQAPWTTGPSQELSYEAACRQIVETFHDFSPELGEFAQTAIDGRWIEAENRTGKRQGGFCTGFPTQQQSRIFMTFTNSPDSMATLAHELGHAYHSHVLRQQPLVLQEYPMNLAETASTFAEAVLGEERLRRCESTEEQLAILDEMLSDSVAFLMNIHTRFLFEDNFHKERTQGELSAERLSELMLAAQREAYLDALAEDGWNPRFWVSKLHFYITSLPFYNFPYTFGYLLSLGLYALAAESGDDFPERYKQFLLATGCRETEEAVEATFGYDLRQKDFWNKSLDVVANRVERFVTLNRS